MKPTGIQLIAEFIQCQKKILNDKKILEKILKQGIQECGLNLKKLDSYQFNPVGITVIAIISESHVVIHTYPEVRHASIDIFTCCSDLSIPVSLLHFLKNQLKPETIRAGNVRRGNSLEMEKKDWIVPSSSNWFEVRYHIKKKLLSKKTKYQQIDIIENENFGRMLFLDKDLQIAEKDAPLYNWNMVSPLIEKNKLGVVAILGGGDGGVLNELLKHNPKKIILVDIDKDVILCSKKFLYNICKNSFSNPHVKIVINDVKKFLETNYGFDAIIYDLTMHPEYFIGINRRTFLNELFLKIKDSLNENGIISLQCCSEFDTEALKLLREILSRYFTHITFVTSFIPSFCENWVFASAEVL